MTQLSGISDPVKVYISCSFALSPVKAVPLTADAQSDAGIKTLLLIVLTLSDITPKLG